MPIGVMLGVYWGYIGIMENKMETIIYYLNSLKVFVWDSAGEYYRASEGGY